jgi:glyoxylase-like metal-dependent hydrolase (beta-lactamase superfamily II)
MELEHDAAPGVHRIEDAFTNWYVIEDGGRLTIVDSGVPASWRSAQEMLTRIGRTPDDVAALVLTHAHFDHLGFAERARREWGVPVYVHEADVPLTRHPWRYDHERARSLYFATQVRALPIAATLVRHRAWFPSPVREVVRFQDGVLPVPGSPHVVFTPGHTQGHCALHLPDRDTIIAGDAIVTLDPYTGRRGPRIVAGAATADSERNLGALDAIAATEAGTVLVGHGEPWRGGAREAVELARRAGPA